LRDCDRFLFTVYLATRSAAVVSRVTEDEQYRVPVAAVGVGAADAGAVGGRLIAAARI